MTLPRRRLLAGAVLTVLIGVFLRWSPAFLDSDTGLEPKRELAEELGAVSTSIANPELFEAASTEGATASPELAKPGTQRVALSGTPDEPIPTAHKPVLDVEGVVLDHLGHPMANVSVRLKSSPGPNKGGVFWRAGPMGVQSIKQQTTERGTFLFEGHPFSKLGTVVYGENLVHGPGFEKKLAPEDVWLELRVPDLSIPTSHVILTVVSSEGAHAVELEDVEFVLVRPPKSNLRTPRAELHQPQIGLGRVDAWLGLGTWRAIVSARKGERRTIEFQVAEAGVEVQCKLILAVWKGAHSEVYSGNLVDGLGADNEALPNIDGGRGLDQLMAGIQRVGYDAQKWDRHFVQTLSFSPGPVKAASLILRLKSISSMSQNDTLNLEYLGERRFLYGRGIAQLPGVGEWKNGERATVHLNLSQLLVKGETGDSVIDLLPQLEDGLLDVKIQDDTAVLDIELRLLR